MKNKRGWIRIVEAFTAIILVTGILLVFFSKGASQEGFSSEKVFEQQQGILRYIQLNNSLREDVLSFNSSVLPVSLEDFPENLKSSILSRTPSYLVCDAKICNLGSSCLPEEGFSGEDVYVQKVVISSSLSAYSPRDLKLFCKRR